MVEDGTPKAGLRAWFGLAVLVVPMLMVAVDMTVLFLAVPAITAALEPSGTQQLWVLHVGELLGAGLVLTAGSLVDRIGARRIMAIGLIAYSSASLFAALAISIEMLIAARVLIGAATVAVTPAAISLARRMFSEERQFATAIALLMAAFSGGMALGPALGGLLLEYFWWGSVFLVNVPVALLVLLGLRILPRVSGTGTGRVDLPSVALSLGGLAGLVYGGQELAASSRPAVLYVAVVGVGLVLMALFLRRQHRLPDPLLDLRLFRVAMFSLPLIIVVVVIAADTGAELQLAQHLQAVTGLSPLHAGLALTVPAVVSLLATAAAPQLLRWYRPPPIIAGGAVVAALSALVMGFAATRVDVPVGWTLLAASGVALGMAPVFALGSVMVLESAPVDKAGSAQSVQDAGGSVGNTVGLAFTGSVAILVYGHSLADRLPAGTPPELLAAASRSIGEGLDVLSRVPAGQMLAVEAFADATGAAYLVAAVGFGMATTLALILGRAHARRMLTNK